MILFQCLQSVKFLVVFFTKDKQAIGDGIFNVGSGQSMTVWEMACLTQNRCEKQLNQKDSTLKNWNIQ